MAGERLHGRALACHESVEAGLLLFALYRQAGAPRERDAAEALRRAASALAAGPVKAALLLEGGRLLLGRGEAMAAAVLCAQALDADPGTLDAAMCGTRAARAAGDPRAALAALERLEQSLATPALRDHALRARARLHEAAGDRALALRLLGNARSLPASRMRARLSEQLQQPSEQRAALEHWAEVAGGSQRALALLGLCELHLVLREGRLAASALERAAHADAGSPLVRTWQAQLARATGETAGLRERAGVLDGGERLQAAARLAAEPDNTAAEFGLLDRARGESHSAMVLALDAAAELGDRNQIAQMLALAAEQLAGPARASLELLRASLHLREGAALEAQQALSNAATAGGSTADAHGAALGQLLRIQYSYEPTALGLRWLELAGLARGELSAWAATLAGDYLRASGRAREAYERALTALPGHAPACWALEGMLADDSLRAPLARVHSALARVTEDPIERAARLLRAALLHEADAPNKDALARIAHELAAISPVDALLCDRTLAADGERVRLLLSEALEAGGHGKAGALSDLCALRAASHYEDAGEHARAAVLYREVLDRRGGELGHAELGLERALSMAGLHALLIERLEHAALRAQDPLARREALERLAGFEGAVGDERRATRSQRALLELAPADVSALLAVQHEAMRDQDPRELCRSAAGHARATSDPREREAQRCLLERAQLLLGTVTPDVFVRERSGEPELREALEQERNARKRGEPGAVAEAVLGLCAHLRDDNERASYAMRAAEALEALSAQRAALALAPYAQAAPRHVLVHEALARLQQAAGESREAAESFERAAGTSPVRARTARLWHRAALVWQDALGDVVRARRALESVQALDPRYRDAFERLRDLLTGEGDQNALCALYAARIAAGGEPGPLADLHGERARLLLRLERDDEARAALKAALALDPQRPGVLRELSELQLSAGQYAHAAETLIKLARVAKDRAVLRKAFFELANGDAETDRFTIELAAILEDMKDPRRAERVLNHRRERSPASPPILAGLSDLYARQNDTIALTVHLDRSLHALRLALEQAPADAARFSILCEVLLRRGRPGAAACAAALAQDLGVADARGEELAARHVSLGNAAFEPGVHERLLPEPLDDAARALARFLEPRSGELFAPLEIESIAAPQGALRTAVDYVRAALGLRELALLAIPGSRCIPLRAEPLALGIGRDLVHCDGDQLAFLLLRASSSSAPSGS